MAPSYREVLRCLLEGGQGWLDPSAKVKVAGKSGISQARSRLGAAPLKKLYDAVVAPIAEKRTKGAWYRQWRLVWRVCQNARLDIEKRLPDGSYLSRIYASSADRRKKRKGNVVRVIEYRLKDVADAEPMHRMMTTILDHEQVPAKELAALYHQRWEMETTLERVENTFARCSDRIAQQDAGTSAAGVLRYVDGTLCHSRPDARSGSAGRRRSRAAFLYAFGACGLTAHGPLRRYSPLGSEKLSTKPWRKFLKSGSFRAATGSTRVACSER